MNSNANNGGHHKRTTPVPKGWNEQLDLAYADNWIGSPQHRGCSLILDNLNSRLKDLTEELQRITLYFYHDRHVGVVLPIQLPITGQVRFLTNLIETSPIDRELSQRLCQVVHRCGEAIEVGEAVTVDYFVNRTHYWLREIMEPMMMLQKAHFELGQLCQILVGLPGFEAELLLPENRDYTEQILEVEDNMFSVRQNGEWSRICGLVDGKL